MLIPILLSAACVTQDPFGPLDQQVPENNEYIRYCNCDPGWVRAPPPAATAQQLSAVACSWAPTASSR